MIPFSPVIPAGISKLDLALAEANKLLAALCAEIETSNEWHQRALKAETKLQALLALLHEESSPKPGKIEPFF
jgi:hypothetical protein